MAQLRAFIRKEQKGCDIGGAKEPGAIYFPTNWGAKEPQNLPNHRVVKLNQVDLFTDPRKAPTKLSKITECV